LKKKGREKRGRKREKEKVEERERKRKREKEREKTNPFLLLLLLAEFAFPSRLLLLAVIPHRGLLPFSPRLLLLRELLLPFWDFAGLAFLLRLGSRVLSCGGEEEGAGEMKEKGTIKKIGCEKGWEGKEERIGITTHTPPSPPSPFLSLPLSRSSSLLPHSSLRRHTELGHRDISQTATH
jgi:hypothetical protein